MPSALPLKKGDGLQLYRNEIAGYDSFDWKELPQAFIVQDGKFTCDTMEDRIPEMKRFMDFLL